VAFAKLQKLGDEKIQKVRNELMKGTACMAVARMIQLDWKDLLGVGEKTLTQMLQRFKNTLVDEGVGPEAKEVVKAEGGKMLLKMLRASSLPVLDRMVAIAEMQEHRIQKLWEKEQTMGGMTIGALDGLISDYRNTLLAIQKVQFDLGVDEFKGFTGRMMQETLKNPDGSVRQRTIVEALTSLDEVFKKRGIYVPQQGQLGSGAVNSKA
jgi:transposase